MNIAELEQYCENHDIIVSTYQAIAEFSSKTYSSAQRGMKGIAINDKGIKSIAYNDNLPHEEKLFTFAHEIGHHIMKHLTERKYQKTAEATEADIFASVLMALSVFAEMTKAATV